ncbi:hypothetical protein L3i20_v244330 [Paenibacillus sp. L3-i20]|nr:hypothetical protein L3i20_v244330 [Paenibacillus sp. L3-i20]
MLICLSQIVVLIVIVLALNVIAQDHLHGFKRLLLFMAINASMQVNLILVVAKQLIHKLCLY